MSESKQVSLQVPSIGREVHYVLPLRSDLRPHVVGEHRPATIIKVWGKSDPDAAVQLCVLLDGRGDKEGWNGETLWATSVRHDEVDKELGTWHWPEHVPNLIILEPVETKSRLYRCTRCGIVTKHQQKTTDPALTHCTKCYPESDGDLTLVPLPEPVESSGKVY